MRAKDLIEWLTVTDDGEAIDPRIEVELWAGSGPFDQVYVLSVYPGDGGKLIIDVGRE